MKPDLTTRSVSEIETSIGKAEVLRHEANEAGDVLKADRHSAEITRLQSALWLRRSAEQATALGAQVRQKVALDTAIRQRYEKHSQALARFMKEAPAAVKEADKADQLPDAIKRDFGNAYDSVCRLAQIIREIKPTLEYFDPSSAHIDMTNALMNRLALSGLPVRFSADIDKESIGATIKRHLDNLLAEAKMEFARQWPSGAPPLVDNTGEIVPEAAQ
jgi:hypothetical protein